MNYIYLVLDHPKYNETLAKVMKKLKSSGAEIVKSYQDIKSFDIKKHNEIETVTKQVQVFEYIQVKDKKVPQRRI